MSGERKDEADQDAGARQPIFLLPGVVSALIGLMAAVHIAAAFLDVEGHRELTYWLAFIPLRFVASQSTEDWLPLLWTPVTHAFLHAGWEHLLINCAWLAIFGTPVARRYGPVATVALFLIAAVAGAAAFTATSLFTGAFLIGASGGVAGLTGAAIRFMFQPVIVRPDAETGQPVVMGRKLASLAEVFGNPRSRWFTLVWIVLNAAVPFLPMLGGGEVSIAWQAHLGGFAAGLLLVPLFERCHG